MGNTSATDHDETVQHKVEHLGRLPDTAAYILRFDRGQLFVAKGPCPKCRAPGQEGNARKKTDASFAGHLTTLEVRLARAAEESDWAEVMITCECGSGHGKDGATSCGRSWSLGAPLEKWTPNDE